MARHTLEEATPPILLDDLAQVRLSVQKTLEIGASMDYVPRGASVTKHHESLHLPQCKPKVEGLRLVSDRKMLSLDAKG